MSTPQQLSIFEERAENLSRDELQDWTVLSDAEQQIVRKLTGPGAKLISGPRGSGKSTLLRLAFFDLIQSQSAFPIYVNYSKALALEPLFHSHADALLLFRQWVLSKILSGLSETLRLWNVTVSADVITAISNAQEYIRSLESGRVPNYVDRDLAPSKLTEMLQHVAAAGHVARTVLLLDDAAHAFSVKQQREFFEVFRELRSREVSAKAAIYPGVTSFSPSFQIGHEAEVIEAWFRPDHATYLGTMQQVAQKRFPAFVLKHGDNANEFIEVLALASFGLPRGFVGLISDVEDSSPTSVGMRSAILEAIDNQADVVRTVFTNIADRLPRFQNYVSVGSRFENAARTAIRSFNKDKTIARKTSTIALTEPIPDEFNRVLRFMEYAGLIRRVEDLSKGAKGNYRRYLIHYACVISGNALSLGKSYKLAEISRALRRPNAHALVKTRAQTMMGSNFLDGCTLALPPCPQCGTQRVSEDQKFCMSCGKELRAASVYLELLKAPVSKLPLPQKKISALNNSGITLIQQLLSDETQSFRKPGSFIGPVWAKRILTAAEEFVSV
jgi:ABC-type molybdenum transport system ATPase subunit/photorepair protein PhrA